MEPKKSMNLVWAIVILVAFAGLIFISVNRDTSNMDNLSEDQATDAGAVAKVGDMITVNYTGRLEDGTVFDSNVDPKFQHVEPFTFPLGAGQVIPGWDKGLVGMKVGDKTTLTIAPEDAYGATGVPGVIPPNATLIFDVELVGIN